MNKSERTGLKAVETAIADLAQQLKEATERNAPADEIAKLQTSGSKLQQEKETLMMPLRAKYPAYYRLWDQLKNDEAHNRTMVLMCQLMPDEEHSATNLEMCEEMLAEVLKKIAELDDEFENDPEKFMQ
jgi:hypothetical protein